MSKYWRTFAGNGQQCFALYVETYPDAVYFDLTQAENSLIRSVPGSFPRTLDLCQEALAERAFLRFVRDAKLILLQRGVEEVENIPRSLLGIGVGGSEDTCAAVVFQQPSPLYARKTSP